MAEKRELDRVYETDSLKIAQPGFGTYWQHRNISKVKTAMVSGTQKGWRGDDDSWQVKWKNTIVITQKRMLLSINCKDLLSEHKFAKRLGR